MDIDLVIRAQHGDTAAYAGIAALIADRFLGVARRILRDQSLAEDATQQALLAVWQDLPQLREPGRFDAWSYRLLVRACHAEGGRERRWATNVRRLALPVGASDDTGSVIDRDQLERGFRRLSLDQRSVIVLHHYLDLPLEQVAEICSIPVGTAHSRLHHAMRALRAALDADLRTQEQPSYRSRASGRSVRKPEADAKDDPRLSDLATLRGLITERDTIDRDSAEWNEHLEREQVLTRKIREWASRSDDV